MNPIRLQRTMALPKPGGNLVSDFSNIIFKVTQCETWNAVACENSRFSSLLASGDFSRGGKRP